MSTGIDAKERPNSNEPPRQLPRLRLGVVLAIAVAVGFVAWLVVRADDDSASTTEVASPAPSPPTSSVSGITVRDLREFAASRDQPIYWAGPRRGMKLSLRRTSDGRFYVRYLPPRVRVGDPRPNFLVVATYPVENAVAAVRNAAEAAGETTRRVAQGGIVYDESPTNAYLAYPGEDYQVEIFHPNPKAALRLVTSGRIAPIR
jgi:hypothetical protein